MACLFFYSLAPAYFPNYMRETFVWNGWILSSLSQAAYTYSNVIWSFDLTETGKTKEKSIQYVYTVQQCTCTLYSTTVYLYPLQYAYYRFLKYFINRT